MRTRRSTTIKDLRLAIDCLPWQTKVAMLHGIRSNQIIAGAYTHSDGICPMLAAHRAGGRTDCISFARAWDRFAFAGSRRASARRATRRELLVLTAHLEASLMADDGPAPDLHKAITEHRQLRVRQAAPPPRPGDPDRAAPRPGDRDRNPELRSHPGWAWLRVMRRLDHYEQALAELETGRMPTAV